MRTQMRVNLLLSRAKNSTPSLPKCPPPSSLPFRPLPAREEAGPVTSQLPTKKQEQLFVLFVFWQNLAKCLWFQIKFGSFEKMFNKQLFWKSKSPKVELPKSPMFCRYRWGRGKGGEEKERERKRKRESYSAPSESIYCHSAIKREQLDEFYKLLWTLLLTWSSLPISSFQRSINFVEEKITCFRLALHAYIWSNAFSHLIISASSSSRSIHASHTTQCRQICMYINHAYDLHMPTAHLCVHHKYKLLTTQTFKQFATQFRKKFKILPITSIVWCL